MPIQMFHHMYRSTLSTYLDVYLYICDVNTLRGPSRWSRGFLETPRESGPRFARPDIQDRPRLDRLSVCPKGLWDQLNGTVRTDNDNKVRARDVDTGGVTTTLQRNPVQSRLNPFADSNSRTVRQQFAPRTLNLGGE